VSIVVHRVINSREPYRESQETHMEYVINYKESHNVSQDVYDNPYHLQTTEKHDMECQQLHSILQAVENKVLAMPTARLRKGADRPVCDLCCPTIMKGKEDTIWCKSSCDMWFHRNCGGVFASHFNDLAGSSMLVLLSESSTAGLLTEVAEFKVEVDYGKP